MQPNDMLVGGCENDVWDARWSALKKVIEKMFEEYGLVEAPRLKTLRPLLLCLKAFGGQRFADFHNGFLSQRLQTWPEFPPDAVLSSIQDQIGFDIAVIDRAILQRISGTSLMKERLEMADRLAWSALQLAVNAGLLPATKMTTTVTYFQKSPDIRVIPYAPVALIGIPYSAQQLDRDLLATSHEVGHYVFGHGLYGGKPLRKYLVDELKRIVPPSPEYDRLLHWLEEIFADVYGVCVAGPVMALDFQDLQLHTGRQRFITDDKKHPTPVLRPHLHLQVLRKREPVDWTAWAEVLEHNWQERLKERERMDRMDADVGGRTRSLDQFVSADQPVIVAETISGSSNAVQDEKPLDKLVTVMLNVLKMGATHRWYNSLPDAPTSGVQSLNLNTLTSLTETLYTAFNDFVLHSPTVTPDQLDPLFNMPLSTEADQTVVLSKWIDAKRREFPQGTAVKPEIWQPYFEGDGWETEGPQFFWP